MAELVHSIREIGLLQPVVVRRTGAGVLRAGDGRASLAGHPGGRAGHDPGDRAADRRRRHAARRAAGEPAPLPAQPARGGGGLPPAARRLRLHPRRAGRPDRAQPTPDQQHAAAAEALAGRAAAGRRRGAVAPGTPGRCSRSTDPEPQDRLAGAGGRRGHLACAASRSWSRSARPVDDEARRASGPHGRPPPGCRSSVTGSATGSTPGSRSTWAAARARSRSSSPR